MWHVKALFGLLIVWLPNNAMAIRGGQQIIPKFTSTLRNTSDMALMLRRKPVFLEVFYESLCPDCKTFFVRSLAPAVRTLGPHLNVKIYPYGNAERRRVASGRSEIKCQHGKPECYGNKLHACAADELRDSPPQAVLCAACLLDRDSNDLAVDKCSSEFSLNATSVKACARGLRGMRLLDAMAARSEQVGFQFVPYVTADGRALGDKEMDQLTHTVCRSMPSPPQQCGAA